KTVQIPILDDNLVEGDQVFTVTLGGATGGAAVATPSSAAVTITDVEPGTLQLSSPTYSVAKNAGQATITVLRTGGSDGAVSVQLATSDGTATAGSDYTAVTQTVSFAAGDSAPKTV